MKFAVISDTHDHLPNIQKALTYIHSQGIDILIHCGDVCAPATLVEIAKQFPGTIHYIFGNVDGDPYLIMKRIYEGDAANVKPYKDIGEFEIAGKKVAITHYPIIAEKLAKSGDYDLVFYGHDHLKAQKKIGRTLLANPGNLADLKYPASFGLYNTSNDSLEIIEAATL